MKKCLQNVSKCGREFWWWRLLEHLWRPSLVFDTKSASKVLHLEQLLVQRAPKLSQNGAQMVPT